MQPKVAIVIPTFRRPENLVEVIRSLLDQPLVDMEIVVMDDGSDDDTEEKVSEFPDPRIRYFNLGKLGVPQIVNAGIVRTDAPYVMFLHDHDRIEPSLLVELSQALDRNPTAAFAFCGYIFRDSELNQEQERWLLDLPELIDGTHFLHSVLMPRINSPVLALSMVRRSALHGELLDPEIGACADVELWHRLASRNDVAYIRKPLIHIRGRDPESQFANARSTLDLMSKSIRLKERFLPSVQPVERRLIGKSWRRQVNAGAAYVVWKALESEDRGTLQDACRYVHMHGTPSGEMAVRLLNVLPRTISLRFMRMIRGAARRVRRSTL